MRLVIGVALLVLISLGFATSVHLESDFSAAAPSMSAEVNPSGTESVGEVSTATASSTAASWTAALCLVCVMLCIAASSALRTALRRALRASATPRGTIGLPTASHSTAYSRVTALSLTQLGISRT
ncbi:MULTISPECIES: hypothetical protein [unclassified Microbacterium]|uniref:hypothetical protein n=1 Tax=unclassified Microbacterium TaxID=2609290 RepID=UPI000EA993CA|nr:MULTISPECIES: hypothetical protein [unclassified Microbacterium]MBT2485040.1 hypothetical protein [Microbacterium sp. ISL-108]RKN67887.1 hypothetical protein D7252_10000 [Microbacterium sp. CGR2]